LGVVVKNFEDPFFGHMIGELQDLAWSKQYSLVLAGCRPGDDQQLDTISLLKYQLDGVIVVGSDFQPEGLDAFSVKGTPIVQIGAGRRREGIPNVAMDQEFGLDQLVTHLKKLGHRDIGYIGDDSAPHVRRERILLATLKDQGLTTRPNALVRIPSRDMRTGYDAMRRLLQRCGELIPTAVVAADDVTAQSALRALFERRISVPTDLSLVGVDDIPSAQMTIPALTTLRQPIKEMVREAFRLLISPARRSKTGVAGEIAVRPELVIRDSCGTPRTRNVRV
jgi:DNA-binding LacI/PurR family transcriptional regulator